MAGRRWRRINCKISHDEAVKIQHGIGDRFAQQGRAQLSAFVRAKEIGIEVIATNVRSELPRPLFPIERVRDVDREKNRSDQNRSTFEPAYDPHPTKYWPRQFNVRTAIGLSADAAGSLWTILCASRFSCSNWDHLNADLLGAYKCESCALPAAQSDPRSPCCILTAFIHGLILQFITPPPPSRHHAIFSDLIALK